MRAHIIQHVPFEDLAAIEPRLKARDFVITSTEMFHRQDLPDMELIDLLIILGGPMGVHDDSIYPWMKPEKLFIEKALRQGKKVLGICLGAQLMAHVLGARVYKNRDAEIGWHPVELTSDSEKSRIFSTLPRAFTPFHWHGDTFDIPAGALRTAGSAACDNQAFVYGSHAVGLQFHLETKQESVERLITHCGGDIISGPHIQGEEEMLSSAGSRIEAMTPVLDMFLEGFINLS